MAMRLAGRARRKRRIRKKVFGSPGRPRLTVFRSHRHIYAQVIDDLAGRTIAAASSHKIGQVPDDPPTGKTSVARAVGVAVASACREKGIEKVVFDRNGYLYHGRVKALAEAARKSGLKF
jgi:large subunit ribosomal protein L18